MHHSRQQCLVAEWLGLSVTVRVRVGARAREWGVRTATVCDVTMMYCKERYMENVPSFVSHDVSGCLMMSHAVLWCLMVSCGV